jgi:Holliday junction resolvase RusA-like endonuclease
MYSPRRGRGKKFRRSDAYSAWITQAHLHWLEQRPVSPLKRVSGYYWLHIVLYPPDKRWRDIDNLIKGVSDFLQKASIIDNDRFSRRVWLDWGGADEAPLGCRVYVRPWQSK